MPNVSKRHHYLPVYFIKGFISPLTELWVYDKKSDTILPSKKSPKSIFYEFSKNNIIIEGKESDILETVIYKYLDDNLANYFKIVQSAEIEMVEQEDLISSIILMLASTYYRIPSTENWTNELTKNVIKNKLPDNKREIVDKIFKSKISDEDKNKFFSTISLFLNFAATENKLFEGKQNFKIVDSQSSRFILSDYPIIYENSPINFIDLSSSLIFPLTEKRVYVGLNSSHFRFDFNAVCQINILLAFQAKQYFASTDKSFLNLVSTAYKDMKPFNKEINEMKKQLFDLINKYP